MIKYLYFLILLLLFNYCHTSECSDITESEASCTSAIVISDGKFIKCAWTQKAQSGNSDPQEQSGNGEGDGNGRVRILEEYEYECTNGDAVSSCTDVSNFAGVTTEQCSTLTDSNTNYKCYSDGTKCVQADSCSSVEATSYNSDSSELQAICSLFDNCEPDGNKCKTKTTETTTDKCNDIESETNCKIISKDEKTLIKCKWAVTDSVGKCETETDDIKLCSAASDLSDITNDQCIILSTDKNYCVKGQSGCIEVDECTDIKFSTDDNFCNQFTEEASYLKCVADGTSGCTTSKKQCLQSATYTYSEGICTNLDVSTDGNQCYSDGDKCVEASSCETVAETTYEAGSTQITAICNLFTNCEPDGKKCKTKTEEKDEEEEEEEESTKTVCSEYTTEANCNKIVKDDEKLVKCIWKEPSTGEDKECLVDSEYESCDSAKELAGVTDDQCKDLTLSTGKYCIGGPSGCIEVSDCDEVEANVDEKVCERITPSVTYKTCTKKEEGTGCEAIGKSCTTQFDDYSKVDCDELTPSVGYTCYNTGEKCKETNSCLDVEATTLSGDDLTAFCKKFGDKCVPDGNKCKIESICPGKEENDCKLTLDSNILFDCEWDAESTPSCKEGTIYETCESAKTLSKATNEQCSALSVGDNQKCVKGDNGCEVVVEEDDDDDDGKTKGNSSTWLFTATIMNLVLILAF